MFRRHLYLIGILLCFGCGLNPGGGPIGPDSSFTMPDANIWQQPEDTQTNTDIDELVLDIASISPDRGSIAGLESVQISGVGFVPGSKVYFGGVESPQVYIQGEVQITALTPPHPRGTVDVEVVRPSGLSAILEGGFTFEAEINVMQVEPVWGSSDGGTALTIHGSGFSEGAYVLIGDRVSPSVEVVDTNTILAVSPVGDPGPADVFVSIQGQVGRLKTGFLYVEEPDIEAVQPNYGPQDGGTPVQVYGTGLNHPQLSFDFGPNAANDINSETTPVEATTPPANATGSVPLLAHTPYGGVFHPNAFIYIDPNETTPGIVQAIPTRGPTSGGTEIDIILQGVTDLNGVEAYIGEVQADILGQTGDGHRLTVRAPSGEQGSVDIRLVLDETEIVLPGGFTYYVPLRVDSITPVEGPQAGGTEVEIEGGGFFNDVQVRFGAMPAPAIEQIDFNRLVVETPPGAPGFVDVVLTQDHQEIVLKDGFEYKASGLQVFLMHPNRGSRAGGTYFRIVGAGFHPGTRVFIGDREAFIELDGSQRITGFSPRGIPGFADVRITSGGQSLLLERGWLYFDPAAYLTGTWGDPVDEAVNVTVLEAMTGDPVMGAFVTLGHDPSTPFQGLTDLNGQITLSGPGLVGPVVMTAAKSGYTAFTIAKFDAENATVHLYRLNPPSPGQPPPVDNLDPGAVQGQVFGLGKYVVIPPGECEEVVFDPESGVPLCGSCIDDGDCNGGFCVEDESNQKYCTRGCTNDEDCPAQFVCSSFGWSEPRCLPTPGIKEIRCYVAPSSIFAAEPEYLPGGIVGDQGVFEFEARLGDVAIVCEGGVLDSVTGVFTPLVMGLQRHAFVLPNETTIDLNIHLNIPLRGSMNLRLGNPLSPEQFPYRSIRGYLDLGSDGVVPIGNLIPQDEIGERYIIDGLPEALSGDLEDAKLTFYAELKTGENVMLPSAEILLNELNPNEFLHHVMLVRNTSGEYETKSIGKTADLNASAQNDQHTFVVGANGSILRYNGVTLGIQSSPTGQNLNDVVAHDDNVFYAVGDTGTILHFDGFSWATLSSPVTKDLYGIARTTTAVWAVGDGIILKGTESGFFIEGTSFSETLNDVACNDYDTCRAVGEDGTVYANLGASWFKESFPTDDQLLAIDSHQDRFVVTGVRGLVAIRDAGDGWQILPPPTYDSVNAVFIMDDNRVVVGGPLGQLYVWDGTSWESLHDEDHLLGIRVLAGNRTTYPELILGHHEIYMGPLLDLPIMDIPTLSIPLARQPYLSWMIPESPLEGRNYIRLFDASGFPMWQIITPQLDELNLPDLTSMANIVVLVPGNGSMRFIRSLAPDFNISSFSTKDLSIYDRHSWCTFHETFSVE
ncbi:MAG: hypothetical protein CMH54_05250 [Myxococcales bacterium]|nr:hypothetical protein [Myxococcales bacterium]